MRIWTSILLFILAALSLSLASASEPIETQHADLTLMADASEIKPGEPFWVAIDFLLQDGWHIYWKNPGDSGLEAQLNWKLPDGFSAGPIHWPTPERIEYSGLFNYGYEDEVGLLVPLTAPDVIPEGSIELDVHVSFLICKDICIPEEASLTYIIHPGETNEDYAERIEELAEDLPPLFKERAEYDINQGNVYLAFDLSAHTDIEPRRIYEAWWFPQDAQVISNADEQRWRLDDRTVIIEVAREGNETPDPFHGILKVGTTDGRTHELFAEVAYTPASAGTPTSVQMKSTGEIAENASQASVTLVVALGLAFLGGIILNIMPCVLPVLSLKALSICKKSNKGRSAIRIEGLAYTAGVVLSFVAVAGALIALQQAGQNIGWGFQLQSPIFVAALIYVLFLVGLNLSGVFEVTTELSGVGDGLTSKQGPTGSFFTGVLATIVATPCTAPFMATALGFALSQPPAIALLIFVFLGLGLAFPFLLITLVPGAVKLLPKPGNWMIRFKQFLSFLIYGTVCWLLWIFVSQIVKQYAPLEIPKTQVDTSGLVFVLIGLLIIAFFAWLLPLVKTRAMRFVYGLIAVVSVLFTLYMQPMAVGVKPIIMNDQDTFSQATLERYLSENRRVFVNATADWCITCKVNERIALRDSDVLATKKAQNIVTLTADWTNYDDEITNYLTSFERSGVPLYVYYEPGEDPVVLPQLLTPAMVLEYFETNEPTGE